MAKVAVIGPGAIGGVAAAGLQQARHDVTICANQAFDTLTIGDVAGVQLYSGPAKVVTDPAKIGVCDWAFLCVKSHQTEGAAAWLKAAVGPKTRLAVLQNGVEHRERVAPFIPAGIGVAPVVLQLPSERTSPGVVRLTGPALMVVPEDEVGREFVSLFGALSGENIVKPKTDPDFVSVMWQKLCLNAPGGAIAALTQKPDAVAQVPGMKELAARIVAECMAVARAEGASFRDDYAEKLLNFLARPGNRGNSMYFDRRDGKRLEWDARNAVIGRFGRKHGIPTPVADTLVPLLRALDPD